MSLRVDLRAKPFYLDDEQIAWVEKTIEGMSLNDKIGQLFLFNSPANETAEETIERLEKINLKPCGFLLRGAVSKDIREKIKGFQEYYEIPIGLPDVKRAGSDITILTVGATLYRALEAADILKEKYNISAEIIDARSITPFDYEPVLESVKKTGKILLASDACERGSHLKDIAQTISELAFDYLDAPPVVIGARNWITPSHELEEHFFPQPEWFIDAIHEKIMPLPGHVAKNNFTEVEQIRRNKLGV